MLRTNLPFKVLPDGVEIEADYPATQRLHRRPAVLALVCSAACALAPAGNSATSQQLSTSTSTPQQPGSSTATQQAAAPPPGSRAPTEADILKGAYGPYRANNDLLYYHLNIRVDPDKQFISGNVTTRFKMLKDDNHIQLDLAEALNVDKIMMRTAQLKYERKFGAVFVDFPETLKTGHIYTIDFYYPGNPVQSGRFGGFTVGKDPQGRPWIYTACEGQGASIWWPDKDQWRDEVENMEISVAIPNGLVDVSNGSFVGKTDLRDGYTR